MSSKQITMVCLDQLVNTKHQYRKFKDLFDFTAATEELKSVESPANVTDARRVAHVLPSGIHVILWFACRT